MRRRKNSIIIRLSDDEFLHLREEVRKSGLAQEPFLRKMIAGYQVKEMPPLEYHKIIRLISAIGNNLNQIAAKANTIHSIDAITYEDNFRKLMNLLINIQKAIEEPEKGLSG